MYNNGRDNLPGRHPVDLGRAPNFRAIVVQCGREPRPPSTDNRRRRRQRSTGRVIRRRRVAVAPPYRSPTAGRRSGGGGGGRGGRGTGSRDWRPDYTAAVLGDSAQGTQAATSRV